MSADNSSYVTGTEENSSEFSRASSNGTNNTLFECVPIGLDTECFLLLGLLYCRDRDN